MKPRRMWPYSAGATATNARRFSTKEFLRTRRIFAIVRNGYAIDTVQPLRAKSAAKTNDEDTTNVPQHAVALRLGLEANRKALR